MGEEEIHGESAMKEINLSDFNLGVLWSYGGSYAQSCSLDERGVGGEENKVVSLLMERKL